MEFINKMRQLVKEQKSSVEELLERDPYRGLDYSVVTVDSSNLRKHEHFQEFFERSDNSVFGLTLKNR